MISIREVPEPGTFDLFEESLLLPVPGLETNSILLEDRDGRSVQRVTAKSVLLKRDGKTAASATDVPIDVFITDARIAWACSKYDKGGRFTGSGGGALVALAINAGSAAMAARRRRGKMLVGQVRYPWLSSVGSCSRMGFGSQEQLHLSAKSSGSELKLVFSMRTHDDAATIATEIARRAAAYRLACETELSAATRERLEELSSVARLDPKKGIVRSHVFPTLWPVSEKSARMLPLGATPPAGVVARTPSALAESEDVVAVGGPRMSDSPSAAGSFDPAAAASRFCTSCGRPASSGLAFCTQCGTPLTHGASMAPAGT